MRSSGCRPAWKDSSPPVPGRENRRCRWRFARRDTRAGAVVRNARSRIELVETIPSDGENGKVHGLVTGLRELETPWVLIIDADTRPTADLVPALLETAAKERVSMLSVATRQVLADRLDQVVHPALLTTLIYRFGIPGHATSDPKRVQANGQCLLIGARSSTRSADSTRTGTPSPKTWRWRATSPGSASASVSMNPPDLISVEMYSGGRETLRNWSRSLPLSTQLMPGVCERTSLPWRFSRPRHFRFCSSSPTGPRCLGA
ncbi:MAG: glycosyltransferase [Thermomicrobiales bacterium]